jgi:hypothetical protein
VFVMSEIRIAHDPYNTKYFVIFLELDFCSPAPPIKNYVALRLSVRHAIAGSVTKLGETQ